jgi:hypothetical protein
VFHSVLGVWLLLHLVWHSSGTLAKLFEVCRSGHDHNLQYLHNPAWGYHHITSGAGSKVGTGFYGSRDSPFQAAVNGEAAFTGILVKLPKIYICL